MDQNSVIFSKAEFEKLLARAAELMREKTRGAKAAPESQRSKIADKSSVRRESKMEIPGNAVSGSNLLSGVRRLGRFLRTLLSLGQSPMCRDLSVLVVTIIAVAVCASCIQNLTLTPLTASVATSQSANFIASFNRNGGNNLKTSWILTQGGSNASCAPGCGTLALSSSGTTYTAIYTAPAAVPTPSTVTLTFHVSDSDGGTAASATITVTGASNALTITPQSQTVIAGSTTTQPFTANQSGSPATGITWALTQGGSSCLPGVCGSLASATANPAIYTPPTTFSASGTVTLTATQASSSQAPFATITVDRKSVV
jgi:VCBS repeat-containing protein